MDIAAAVLASWQAETLVIVLLLIVSLVAMAVRRLRVPYAVAPVVVGLLITFHSLIRLMFVDCFCLRRLRPLRQRQPHGE